jgi:hypothetical protein
MNAYTYGTEGYFHTDSARDDDRTAIIYMVDQWDPDWAGETAFLDAQGDLWKSVLPRRNRAIIFPSNIQHVARSVSRKCVALRKTLIFKTRRPRSNNFEKLSVFLRKNGATNYQHRNGTLHDHLVRTFAILELRQLEDGICFGGGLHAFYGTNIYPWSLMTESSKSDIVANFGEKAEHLAYLFSMIDRPTTLESPSKLTPDIAVVEQRDKQAITLSRIEFDALRMIECANLEDQKSLGRFESLSKEWATPPISRSKR